MFEGELLIDSRGNLICFRSLALYLCSAAKLLEIVNYGFNGKYLDDSYMPSSSLCLITLQNALVLSSVRIKWISRASKNRSQIHWSKHKGGRLKRERPCCLLFFSALNQNVGLL